MVIRPIHAQRHIAYEIPNRMPPKGCCDMLTFVSDRFVCCNGFVIHRREREKYGTWMLCYLASVCLYALEFYHNIVRRQIRSKLTGQIPRAYYQNISSHSQHIRHISILVRVECRDVYYWAVSPASNLLPHFDSDNARFTVAMCDKSC